MRDLLTYPSGMWGTPTTERKKQGVGKAYYSQSQPHTQTNCFPGFSSRWLVGTRTLMSCFANYARSHEIGARDSRRDNGIDDDGLAP